MILSTLDCWALQGNILLLSLPDTNSLAPLDGLRVGVTNFAEGNKFKGPAKLNVTVEAADHVWPFRHICIYAAWVPGSWWWTAGPTSPSLMEVCTHDRIWLDEKEQVRANQGQWSRNNPYKTGYWLIPVSDVAGNGLQRLPGTGGNVTFGSSLTQSY